MRNKLEELTLLALDEPKTMSYDFIVDFVDDEFDELSRGEILKRVMDTLRPNTSKMSRAEKECVRMIPDYVIEKDYIESIVVEKFIAEETFNYRLIIRVYLKDEHYKTI